MARQWLWRHWGTTQKLCQVQVLEENGDRRLRRSARVIYEFLSADWTPWQAILRLRRDWPTLFLAAPTPLRRDRTGPAMPDDGAGEKAALSPAHPTGDALWDDWDTPPRVPSAPVLHLDGFDGPIDLLLDLAERQRLDLGRHLEPGRSCGPVRRRLRAARRACADRAPRRLATGDGDTAGAILLRSRHVRPRWRRAEEAARDAAREIRAPADALRFVRAAASWLQARPQLGRDVFARAPPGPDPQVASYMALLEACLTVLRGRDEVPAATPVYRLSVR